MLLATPPEHEPFPDDSRLYFVYWGGEIASPANGQGTPRARYWLAEVGNDGSILSGRPLTQVTESAGSIPAISIGSYWRHRRIVPFREVGQSLVSFDLLVPDKWECVSAWEVISRNDLPLKLFTKAGREVPGYLAPVVFADAAGGQKVAIPSYEIFRSMFAGSSALALALLSNTWDAQMRSFIRGGTVVPCDEGDNVHLIIAPGVPARCLPYLAMLYLEDGSRRAANKIYPDLIQQNGKSVRWIRATPPAVAGTLRITGYASKLSSSNVFLVTRIVSIQFPRAIASLTYSIDGASAGQICIECGSEEVQMVDRVRGKVSSVGVSRPIDRRPTKRTFLMPARLPYFDGLPDPRRQIDDNAELDVIPKPKEVETPSEIQVSTGETGDRKGPRGAHFTPEQIERLGTRFDEILALLARLVEAQIIESVEITPLVRPMPAEDPQYCGFSSDGSDEAARWATVADPDMRPRAALVLQIKVGGRIVTWIEVETLKDYEHYRSVAVEMKDHASVDEGVIDVLLDMCAELQGVWPKKLELLEGKLLYQRATHSRTRDGDLSPNIVLGALQRLRVTRATSADGSADRVCDQA